MLCVNIIIILIYIMPIVNSTFFKSNTSMTESLYVNDTGVEDCLISICDRYATTVPTILFSEDIAEYSSANMFLYKYKGQRVIKSNVDYKVVEGMYLFFTELNYNDIDTYEFADYEYNEHVNITNGSKLKVKQQLYDINMSYIVIIRNNVDANTSTNLQLTVVERYMDQFWEFKLMNIIVLMDHQHTINVYTYYPYSRDHCSQVGRPLLLDVWNKPNKTFILKNENLFNLEDKVRNLHGCTLHGIGKTRPPESIIIPHKNNTWELHGTGGFMLQLLEEYLNFTTLISIPANKSVMDEFGYSVSDGIPQKITANLVTQEKDFAFGIYSYIIYFFPGTEFTKAALSECFIWYAPCKAGRKPSLWNNYVKEFSFINWVLIVLIFVITVVINMIYNNMITSLWLKKENESGKPNTIVFTIFAIFIGQSVGKQIEHLMPKCFTVMWVFYCLIIYSGYQASLGSFMTVPWETKNVETYEEILEFNFKIVGNPQSFNIYNKSIENSQIMQRIARRYKKVGFGKYDSIIKQMVDDRDTVAFGAQRFQQHYSVHRSDHVKSKDPICVVGNCVIESSASPFLLKRGSPLSKPINTITSRMFEAGILNWIWSTNAPHADKLLNRIQNKKFELKSLLGAIILYVVGIIISIILFILEHIHRYYQIRKTNTI